MSNGIFQQRQFSLVSILRKRYISLIGGLIALGMPWVSIWSQSVSGIRPSKSRDARAEQQLRPSAKIVRYSKRLLQKYDQNHDGALQKSEWTKMRGNPKHVDTDGDDIITTDELIARVFSYGNRRRGQAGSVSIRDTYRPRASVAIEAGQIKAIDASVGGSDDSTINSKAESNRRRRLKFYVPLARLPTGVPPWFLGRDQDGDAQLTLSEFAPSASRTALEEFARRDLNRDGILTTREYVRAAQRNDRPKTTSKQ